VTVEARFNGGTVTKLDLAHARSTLEQTEASIAVAGLLLQAVPALSHLGHAGLAGRSSCV
jgi:hypothetical protein